MTYSIGLEKAAHDCGFDLSRGTDGAWLVFESSHCPLVIWLNQADTSQQNSITVAFSMKEIREGLKSFGDLISNNIPRKSVFSICVESPTLLYALLRRAYQLSRAIPDEPLKEFQKQIVDLSKATEIERLAIQRVGQDIFRERLFDFWDGKCSVTGLAIPALLKASHIKPWKDCATDAERLDVYNGLLLAPHFDAAFDRGFISFGDDGFLLASKLLGSDGLKILGIDGSAKISGLTSAHFKYLVWHRAKVFKGPS